MQKVRVTIDIVLSSDIPLEDVREYCRDAVRSMGGEGHPDDWSFGANKQIVAVHVKRMGLKHREDI